MKGLSEKEQRLFDFIKANPDAIIAVIETILGKEYTGALGRLVKLELIEKTKKKLECDSNLYGWKYIKVYNIKEKKEDRKTIDDANDYGY